MIPSLFFATRKGVRVLEAWDKDEKAPDGLGSWPLRIPLWLFVVLIWALGVAKATFIWKTTCIGCSTRYLDSRLARSWSVAVPVPLPTR